MFYILNIILKDKIKLFFDNVIQFYKIYKEYRLVNIEVEGIGKEYII